MRCNRCSVDKCTLYKNKRHSKKCSYFKPLESFKTPLLVHLLHDENKIDGTVDVLSAFNINIVETNNYPFFKLNIKGESCDGR